MHNMKSFIALASASMRPHSPFCTCCWEKLPEMKCQLFDDDLPMLPGSNNAESEIWAPKNIGYPNQWKSSNGRKMARMARISTIFGSNESSRRDLFLEKKSKERNQRKVFEKFKNRKIFGRLYSRPRFRSSRRIRCGGGPEGAQHSHPTPSVVPDNMDMSPWKRLRSVHDRWIFFGNFRFFFGDGGPPTHEHTKWKW